MPEVRLIDANALKTHVCDMCDDGQRECKGDESCAILCWINDMPTIKAEPVRYGEWHECWHTDTVCASICTNCGKAATQGRVIVGQELMTNVRYPLCPHCAARMEV